MSQTYIVHGAKGSGSVAVEAALTLLDLPYEVTESAVVSERGNDHALGEVNPMRQVPALVLPSGEVMTESAAILIWLADDHPEAGLSPTMASAARPAFLRWMTFVSSAIHALSWIRDDPSRLVSDAAAQTEAMARTADRRAECWKIMDGQIDPGRYILGDELSVLDLYVAVTSRWGPRRRRFYGVAPKMASVVRRVDHEPRLARLWADRFPFTPGWEG